MSVKILFFFVSVQVYPESYKHPTTEPYRPTEVSVQVTTGLQHASLSIDVKNVFYVFLFLSRFFTSLTFIFRTFLKSKTLEICYLCNLIVRFNFSYATFLNSKLVRLWEFNQ